MLWRAVIEPCIEQLHHCCGEGMRGNNTPIQKKSTLTTCSAIQCLLNVHEA